jgi:hypothetical protein
LNSGKLIGFDLDGCLGDTDSVKLRLIDMNPNPDERKFEYELFYRQVKPIFSVKEYMHEGDKGIIITARDFLDEKLVQLTKRWVAKYFPEFSLEIVGQDIELKNKGLWKEWQDDIVQRKLKIIRERGVYVYFDDSPTIVEGLRANGVVCMQFGGRI